MQGCTASCFGMNAAWLTITAFAVVLWTARSQEVGLSCKNGGTCSQRNGSQCLLCSCATGYVGANCDELLMKVSGSVQYNSSAKVDANSTEPLFQSNATIKERLKDIFNEYQKSSLETYNSQSYISVIKFDVYLKTPAEFNATLFIATSEAKLRENATRDAVFFNSAGITVRSLSFDVDECASGIYVCGENEECFNTDPGYDCVCKSGFSRDNSTECTQSYCLLSNAPTWPSSATRNITYPNGTVNSAGDGRVPSRTLIQYNCPERYMLVNSATGKAETKVIECLGSKQPTTTNTGWRGNDVRCDMTLEFMVAIIMAASSCAIIVLVGGAMIVAHGRKNKPRNSDTEVFDMSESNH